MYLFYGLEQFLIEEKIKKSAEVLQSAVESEEK